MTAAMYPQTGMIAVTCLPIGTSSTNGTTGISSSNLHETMTGLPTTSLTPGRWIATGASLHHVVITTILHRVEAGLQARATTGATADHHEAVEAITGRLEVLGVQVTLPEAAAVDHPAAPTRTEGTGKSLQNVQR